MKKKSIGFTMLGTLFLAGCAGVDLTEVSDEDLARISEKAVVCNAPYIRVGIECCLDVDNNNICDRDEQVNENGDENYQDDLVDEVFEDFENDEEIDSENELGDLLDEEFNEIDELEEEFEELEEEYTEMLDEIEELEEELEELERERFEDKSDEEEFENEDFEDQREDDELEFEADGIEVEYDKEKQLVSVEWEKLDDKEMFKYYKVLISNDNPDMTYPETSAVFVGQDVNEHKFDILTKKLEKGVNYFRVGYVLTNGEVYHTETIKIIIE